MSKNIAEGISSDQLSAMINQVAELTNWRAAQEQQKKARIGKIFDEINEVLRKNFVTHEEAISLFEMLKQQTATQYVSELNK